ncbi:DUF4355 domain-containing protein [Cytobacillus kochii]|uniref:DUF4355 domain-containing protein n=1 Tax=Cytobacillus kochii TaxID=859143 RepID=UPI001CD46C18|nr:DUF4355 domain-containing protein [Cytobacillus kochii]MCA1027338.1 DUF4355 domain-containing protein [Cytobacillus kochii]
MELKEIQEFFESNKNNQEVNEYLQGLKSPTLEGVQQFVTSNEDAKKWFSSEKDKHFDKGLNTWMEKTFPQKLDEEIKKRYPDETPEQQRIRELEMKFEEEARKSKIAEVKLKAQSVANEKKLPLSIIDLVVSDNEDKTLESLSIFEEAMQSFVQNEVENRLKDGDYIPPSGGKITSNLEGFSASQLISQGFSQTK